MTNVGIAGESTAIGDALMQSLRALSYGHAKQKAIILITDGYHNAGTHAPKEAVEKAKKAKIKIYTIGLGKATEYDRSLLERIAKETSAKSYAANSAKSLKRIYEEIDKLEPSPLPSEAFLGYQLLHPILLWFALILLAGWTLWDERSKR